MRRDPTLKFGSSLSAGLRWPCLGSGSGEGIQYRERFVRDPQTVIVGGHRRDNNTTRKRSYRKWNDEWYVLMSESEGKKERDSSLTF